MGKKSKKKDAAQTEEQATIQGYIKSILKNIKLEINRIHIRYEDDYFSQINPMAFGILCEQISSCGSVHEWEFGSLDNNQFHRVSPPYLNN